MNPSMTHHQSSNLDRFFPFHSIFFPSSFFVLFSFFVAFCEDGSCVASVVAVAGGGAGVGVAGVVQVTSTRCC